MINMTLMFSDIKLELLDTVYPVPNYPKEQGELWEKIRAYSAAPKTILDRIESMLPKGKFYDKYLAYACNGAAFFAIDAGSESPLKIGREDHKIILDSLTKVESPRRKELTLLCFYENPVTPKSEFHFAIDLGLKIEERIAFHKAGWINLPGLTFTENIEELYHDCRTEYFVLPNVVLQRPER